LPGTVGGVAQGRHRIEGEAVFEFAESLLMSATTIQEVPKGASTEPLVGRDR